MQTHLEGAGATEKADVITMTEVGGSSMHLRVGGAADFD